MNHRIFLFTLVMFSAISPALADETAPDQSHLDDLSFTTQCPKFLKEADAFGHECVAKAREQVRYFHPQMINGLFGPGEKEVHKVYFQEAKPGSHFSLGCSIDGDKGSIGFLGVYYATDSSYFKAANEAPIRYTTFLGDAGFWLNKKPINLVAVRPFDTKDFPRLDLQKEPGIIRNCQSSILPDGSNETIHGHLQIMEEHPLSNDNISLRICFGTACSTDEYIDFFSTKSRDILWNEVDRRMVTSGGDLIVQKEFFEKSCKSMQQQLLDTPNIVQEICTKSMNSNKK